MKVANEDPNAESESIEQQNLQTKCSKCSHSFSVGGFHNCKRYLSVDLHELKAKDEECEANINEFIIKSGENIRRLCPLENNYRYNRQLVEISD